MKDLILIAIILIALFIIYKFIKPYTIKYDTTLVITGGLGSGKSLTSVKTAINLIQRNVFKWKINNYIVRPIKNLFIKIKNAKIYKFAKYVQKQINPNKHLIDKLTKWNKKYRDPISKTDKPRLYSNIPIYYNPNLFFGKKEYSIQLTNDLLLLNKEMSQNCVVMIDEFPQFINQFNWDIELVQNNFNEFITLFRHYYGGYLIINAQSVDDIVVQMRRKGNQAIWCYNFKKHLFGLFYTIDMCDIMLNDKIQTYTTSFIADNTKHHYGLFPSKNTYDTRCYSNRLKNILHNYNDTEKTKYTNKKTNKVLRIVEYKSPLDDYTSKTTKLAYENEIKELNKTQYEQ